MYSGHVVILDTIHVSGQVTDGFMIGLPYKYSANVLEGFAYDDTHVYQLNLGVQLGQSADFMVQQLISTETHPAFSPLPLSYPTASSLSKAAATHLIFQLTPV